MWVFVVSATFNYSLSLGILLTQTINEWNVPFTPVNILKYKYTLKLKKIKIIRPWVIFYTFFILWMNIFWSFLLLSLIFNENPNGEAIERNW